MSEATDVERLPQLLTGLDTTPRRIFVPTAGAIGLIVAVALVATAPAAAAAGGGNPCSDASETGDINLENSRFSVTVFADGGFEAHEADGDDITFPADTSMLSVRVDGTTYDNDHNFNLGNHRLATCRNPDNPDQAISVWMLPEDVRVVQRITVGPDQIDFEVSYSNEGSDAHTVDTRYLWDTQLKNQDGAPLREEGGEIRTTETNFAPVNFGYWSSFSDNTQDADLITYAWWDDQPDRVAFTHWPASEGSSYAYTVDPDQKFFREGFSNSPESDSAVLMYWEGRNLQAGEATTITSHYSTSLNLGLDFSLEAVESPLGVDEEVRLDAILDQSDADLSEDDFSVSSSYGELDPQVRETGDEGVYRITVENPGSAGTYTYDVTIQTGAGVSRTRSVDVVVKPYSTYQILALPAAPCDVWTSGADCEGSNSVADWSPSDGGRPNVVPPSRNQNWYGLPARQTDDIAIANLTDALEAVGGPGYFYRLSGQNVQVEFITVDQWIRLDNDTNSFANPNGNCCTTGYLENATRKATQLGLVSAAQVDKASASVLFHPVDPCGLSGGFTAFKYNERPATVVSSIRWQAPGCNVPDWTNTDLLSHTIAHELVHWWTDRRGSSIYTHPAPHPLSGEIQFVWENHGDNHGGLGLMGSPAQDRTKHPPLAPPNAEKAGWMTLDPITCLPLSNRCLGNPVGLPQVEGVGQDEGAVLTFDEFRWDFDPKAGDWNPADREWRFDAAYWSRNTSLWPNNTGSSQVLLWKSQDDLEVDQTCGRTIATACSDIDNPDDTLSIELGASRLVHDGESDLTMELCPTDDSDRNCESDDGVTGPSDWPDQNAAEVHVKFYFRSSTQVIGFDGQNGRQLVAYLLGGLTENQTYDFRVSNLKTNEVLNSTTVTTNSEGRVPDPLELGTPSTSEPEKHPLVVESRVNGTSSWTHFGYVFPVLPDGHTNRTPYVTRADPVESSTPGDVTSVSMTPATDRITANTQGSALPPLIRFFVDEDMNASTGKVLTPGFGADVRASFDTGGSGGATLEVYNASVGSWETRNDIPVAAGADNGSAEVVLPHESFETVRRPGILVRTYNSTGSPVDTAPETSPLPFLTADPLDVIPIQSTIDTGGVPSVSGYGFPSSASISLALVHSNGTEVWSGSVSTSEEGTFLNVSLGALPDPGRYDITYHGEGVATVDVSAPTRPHTPRGLDLDLNVRGSTSVGHTTPVEVTIENTGVQTLQNITVNVNTSSIFLSVDPLSGGVLAPGESTTGTIELTPTAAGFGTIQVNATADNLNTTFESRTHGVYVSDIDLDAELETPRVVEAGQTVAVDVNLSHGGGFQMSDMDLNATLRGVPGRGGNRPVVSFRPQDNISATFGFDTSGLDAGEHTVDIELRGSPAVATDSVNFTVADPAPPSIAFVDAPVGRATGSEVSLSANATDNATALDDLRVQFLLEVPNEPLHFIPATLNASSGLYEAMLDLSELENGTRGTISAQVVDLGGHAARTERILGYEARTDVRFSTWVNLGWTPFSLPPLNNWDDSPAAALAPIQDSVEIVWHYDPLSGTWESYNPSAAAEGVPQNLDAIKTGPRYWLLMDQADRFYVRSG